MIATLALAGELSFFQSCKDSNSLCQDLQV